MRNIGTVFQMHVLKTLDGINNNYMFVFPDAAVAEEGSVGEVSLQVDLFTHPGTGEHKITVKGGYF